MKLNKFDEIDSLVHGVEFMVNNNNDETSPEVFYYTEVNENTGIKQVTWMVYSKCYTSLMICGYLTKEATDPIQKRT